MKKVIIVRGAPGSGKSTHARSLMEAYQREGKTVSHYEADMYFIGEDGKYKWSAEKIGSAHKWCQDKVRDSIKVCDVVIVSNTSVRSKDVDVYVKIADEAGAKHDVYRMFGQFQNLHEVPESIVKRMRDSMEDYPGEICVAPKRA